jgi:3-isopropylmalate dehydrogenase
MPANKKILILPGDGIGPEVMREAERVMEWLAKRRSFSYEIKRGLVGGSAYDAKGVSITDETVADAMASDAVLFGSVGGPKWDNVPRQHRPEAGLLRLRKDLDLFANLRPAIVFDSMLNASTLKPEVIKGLDLMIIRELTSGVYFGEPRGSFKKPDGTRYAIDTQYYTASEVERVARVGFELARKRGNRLHSVDKANVMETGVFWRAEVSALHKKDYASVELQHMYADNCAMQLVRNPKQFDVIVTDNLFGDILSDCAAMLTGSLGMLPSASLGPADSSGRRRALYEPVHGSAPDIAGKNLANPIAQLLSLSMMLRYSFDDGPSADLVDKAIQRVLAGGVRTGDIMAEGARKVSTVEMGNAILAELDKLA